MVGKAKDKASSSTTYSPVISNLPCEKKCLNLLLVFTGLISLALFGPIVGLKTSSKGEGLFVTPHIGIVVLLVATCIVGRFLIGLNSLRKKEINFSDVELQQAMEYAAEDADVTLRLANLLKPRLASQPDLWRLFNEVELPLSVVLAEMELEKARAEAKLKNNGTISATVNILN